MMGTASSPNMLDAINSRPIGPEFEQVCPQSPPPSSTMDKRKHVATGDSPPLSPPHTEKRIRVENVEHAPELSPAGKESLDGEGVVNVEQAPESLPPPGEQKRDKGVGVEYVDQPVESAPPPGEQKRDKGVEIMEQPQNIDVSKLEALILERDRNVPAWVLERFKIKAARLKPSWDAFGTDRWDHFRICMEGGCPDPDMGTDSGVVINQGLRSVHEENQSSEGCVENVSPNACFTPILNFKEKHEFYHELSGFAEKAVSYFNDKNDQKLCFDDIESVASCHSSGNHFLLTVKAVDTVDVNSVIVLQGKVRRGIVEAEVDDCKILRLAAY